MKLHTLNRLALLFTVLAVGAFCPNLRAGWGSLQGNNRSTPAPSAPRAQPEANHQPPPVVRASDSEPRQAAKPVVREQPQVAAHARAVETDRRQMDVDQERSQSFFWSDFHAGMRIDKLPGGYSRIGVRGHPYFYFQGVFYDDGSSGYVIVAPPVDAIIPELPPGAESVVLGNVVYYYAAGAFFVQQSDGYVVVAAPMGATVTLLPPAAASVVIHGTACYQADGTYYMPVMQNGVTAYLTGPQP